MRDIADHYDAWPRRRRRWPIIVPVVGLVVLALGWSAFWYFAASRADTMLTAWRAREAARGHDYSCAEQAIAGFPFRMEVRCGTPRALLRDLAPPLAIEATSLTAVAQVYDPLLVSAQAVGPATLAEAGRGPMLTARWSLAQASVRGLPAALDRLSAVFDRLEVVAQDGAAARTAATADHLEFNVRQAPRLPQDQPAVDLTVRLAKGTFPPVPQLAAPAVDAEIVAIVHGLNDYSPKPWRERLRDLAAANGRLEIKPSRVQQGDIITTGQGTLTLTPQGRLDGEIRLTVAGLEQLVTKLGLDQAMARASQLEGQELK